MSTRSVDTEIIAQIVIVHNRNIIMHFLKSPISPYITSGAISAKEINNNYQYFLNYIMTVYLIQINLDIMISNCFW